MPTSPLVETFGASGDSWSVPSWISGKSGLAAVLAVLGLTTIWTSVLMLWSLWTTDALKSIGMIVPLVSFVLVLRAWRSLGWEMDGSWWGFALLLGTALLVRVRDQTVMVLELGSTWNLYFPPHSLVLLFYGVGVTWLFGGWRLVRASAFPLLFLLLVNPVPHIFNVYVDLPLQRASAHVARGFAHALGQPLSPDHLRLMFTPEFGMFIAPGCNGIRGAVTMGLIALVGGYVYRLRWRRRALVVVAAVLLGYLFNLLRLCVLVVFYVVALHVPKLQDHAENADYLIGAVLFFVAVYLFQRVLPRLGKDSALAPDGEAMGPGLERRGSSFYGHAAAMTLLVALGVYGVVQGERSAAQASAGKAEESALGHFPQRVGRYSLVRRWNETLLTGALLFHWAEYAPENGGTHVTLGLSPVLGAHDTLVCHTARGDDPLWRGQQTIRTEAAPVDFSAAFYNDGATQFLEETTLCNGATCGEYASPPAHFGFVFSKPRAETFLSQRPERPIPILLRAETVDTTLPAEKARTELSADLTAFLSGVSLDGLTEPYRGR